MRLRRLACHVRHREHGSLRVLFGLRLLFLPVTELLDDISRGRYLGTGGQKRRALQRASFVARRPAPVAPEVAEAAANREVKCASAEQLGLIRIARLRVASHPCTVRLPCRLPLVGGRQIRALLLPCPPGVEAQHGAIVDGLPVEVLQARERVEGPLGRLLLRGELQVRVALKAELLEQPRIRQLSQLVSGAQLVEVEMEAAQVAELLHAVEGAQVVVVQRQLLDLVVAAVHRVDRADVSEVQLDHFGLKAGSRFALSRCFGSA